jgi:hypothetical protein
LELIHFWNRVSSARTVACRWVAASSVPPRYVTWHPLLNVEFGHTRPDRSAEKHDPISGKFNSRIINAFRFNTTTGNRRCRLRCRAAELDPSGLSVIPRAPVSVAQVNHIRSHDAQSTRRNVCFFDTNRTCRGRPTMSAPEGKTDVPREPGHFRF